MRIRLLLFLILFKAPTTFSSLACFALESLLTITGSSSKSRIFVSRQILLPNRKGNGSSQSSSSQSYISLFLSYQDCCEEKKKKKKKKISYCPTAGLRWFSSSSPFFEAPIQDCLHSRPCNRDRIQIIGILFFTGNTTEMIQIISVVFPVKNNIPQTSRNMRQ